MTAAPDTPNIALFISSFFPDPLGTCRGLTRTILHHKVRRCVGGDNNAAIKLWRGTPTNRDARDHRMAGCRCGAGTVSRNEEPQPHRPCL